MGRYGGTMMKMRMISVLILLASACSAQAQVVNGPDYVYVSGQAATKVMPDMFPVNLSVSRTSQDVDDARRDIEEQVRRFVAQARDSGIKDDDMNVRDLRVERTENEDERSGKLTYLGHSISRNLEFVFRDVQALRKFLSSIRMTRDVEVRLGNPDVDGASEVRRKLLADAVRSARTNADLLATAAGRRLGPAHTVSDRPIRVPVESSATTLDSVMVTGAYARAKGAIPELPVVVEPKSIEITVTAYAIFRLID